MIGYSGYGRTTMQCLKVDFDEESFWSEIFQGMIMANCATDSTAFLSERGHLMVIYCINPYMILIIGHCHPCRNDDTKNIHPAGGYVFVYFLAAL